MSRHIAPHRWADAVAGKIQPSQRATMELHAAACAQCARARRQVEDAAETFAAIRSQPTPAVRWDAVRAGVHWSVSTAKHRQVDVPSGGLGRALRFGAALGALAVIAAVYVALRAPTVRAPAVVATASPPPPAPLTALVTRLAGDVWIDSPPHSLNGSAVTLGNPRRGTHPGDPWKSPTGDGAGVIGGRPATSQAAFAQVIAAGTVLKTADGRIDVQFGQASGFALGPGSTLKVMRLDRQAIELAVDGVVDINVGPRARGERFLVIAGNQTIEVRGTRFVVRHDANGTRVACHHGVVAVRDSHRTGSLEVATAQSAFIAADRAASQWNDAEAIPLTVDEIADFTRTEPWIAPLWGPDLAAQSASLEITAATKRNVRVDGIELGEAPLQMRVMPGRHTIETADSAGRYRRAGWVDVDAAHGAAFAVVDAVAQPATASIAQRKQQFAAGIDRARLGACTRRLAKSGLTDTVRIEIAVDRHGAVNMLNVIDTDLPAETATCVHDVLSDVNFGVGPAATWRDQIDL